MLIDFTLENFKSFYKPQRLNMVPGKYRNKPNHVVRRKNVNVLKLSTIYGANASGKSNLVEAIAFLKHIIIKGKIEFKFKDLCFKLNEESKNKPTNFECKILIEEKIYAFGLSVNLNNNRVEREYLYEIRVASEKLIYDFDYKNDNMILMENDINKENKERINIYMKDIKNQKNELFLSHISKLNFDNKDYFINSIRSIFTWFFLSLKIITPNTHSNFMDVFDEKSLDEEVNILDLLKDLDTGITDYSKETIERKRFEKILSEDFGTYEMEVIEEINKKIDSLEEKEGIILSTSRNYFRIKKLKGKDDVEIDSLKFRHCDKNCAEFSYNEESDGTKRLIELANILIISNKKNRNVFIVDELNRSLHPNMTVEFVKKFIDINKEKEGNQLIITTHEAALMDLNILRQDEIWFVDRDSEGYSNLIPLSKYNIRNDKVLNKDYLVGRYNGIPHIIKIYEKDME